MIVLEKFPLKAKGVEGMLVEEVIDVWCRGCCCYATTKRSKRIIIVGSVNIS